MTPPPRPKQKQPAAVLQEPETIPVNLNQMPPEERAPLEKAFNYFGDHVVEIEGEK